MAIEIERRFLVEENFQYIRKFKIKQGYLLRSKEKTVRVRVMDTIAYMTTKITINDLSKEEYEYEIPLDDAIKMLNHCDDYIAKTRHIYMVDNNFIEENNKIDKSINGKDSTLNGKDCWEIDVFEEDNLGLIQAEIEIPFEEYKFELPSFIKEEITGIDKYYNCNLAKHPYKNWK